MQNYVKRKNIDFVEKCCEICLFGPVKRVLDHSGSYDMHMKKKNLQNSAKNGFCRTGCGSELCGPVRK